MIEPPEFTSRDAVEDFITASRRTTGIAPIELRQCGSPERATAWLRRRWTLYYVPEHYGPLLAEFASLRLSK